MLLGNCNHSLQAFWKDPVIPKNWLAVLACRRDLAHRPIEIGKCGQELRVLQDSDAMVLGSIMASDLQGPIRAAIVDDGIFPILIGLRQDALNALSKVLLLIVNRSYDADQRR